MKQLLCIGHRGAMGHEPENTLRSIKKAMDLGSPCVEIDVHLVENRLVVIHDDTLERTTSGSGLLSGISFSQLRRLDAGHGEMVPTLDEVCDLIQGKACLNIELKGANTAAPVVAYIETLVASGWQYESLLVSAFDHSQLTMARNLNDQILVGVLVKDPNSLGTGLCEQLGAFSVNVHFASIDEAFVADQHNRGRRVLAYTVNEDSDIARMAEYGVDGVFTNFPEKVLSQYDQASDSVSWIERTNDQ